jgi:RNA polymerase sigma factor (sigma-70 family)
LSLLPDNNDLNISQLHDIVRNKVLIFLAKNKPFLETDLITTAEELTSEGVALYLKRLKKKELKLKAPPIGYVFKICRNTFINQYRKQKKLPTTITDDFSAFKYNDANHENTNPELQDVIDSLQQNLLKLFNESLTDSCKQLFYWRYKCEWDFATIAQVLNITTNTARQRHFACKTSVQKQFPEHLQKIIYDIAPQTLPELLEATRFLDDWANDFNL